MVLCNDYGCLTKAISLSLAVMESCTKSINHDSNNEENQILLIKIRNLRK